MEDIAKLLKNINLSQPTKEKEKEEQEQENETTPMDWEKTPEKGSVSSLTEEDQKSKKWKKYRETEYAIALTELARGNYLTFLDNPLIRLDFPKLSDKLRCNFNEQKAAGQKIEEHKFMEYRKAWNALWKGELYVEDADLKEFPNLKCEGSFCASSKTTCSWETCEKAGEKSGEKQKLKKLYTKDLYGRKAKLKYLNEECYNKFTTIIDLVNVTKERANYYASKKQWPGTYDFTEVILDPISQVLKDVYQTFLY